jgi:hypothetical protein
MASSEKIIANEVVSRCFFWTAPGTRSRIHFFPTAGTAGGHYPVACSLRLFGKGLEARSVELEGGRVSQPDGVRIEDAFPDLPSDISGPVGLEVGLKVSQGRLNLLGSEVFIVSSSAQMNMVYNGAPFRVVYRGEGDPAVVQEVVAKRTGLVAVERGQTASLIIINTGADSVQPKLTMFREEREEAVQLGTIAPSTVFEFPLHELLMQGAQKHQIQSTEVQMAPICCNLSEDIAQLEFYVLYRDANSKTPCFVNVL